MFNVGRYLSSLSPPLLQHNGSSELHNASVGVGEEIAALSPDIIFISTPHGISTDRDFLFYENSVGSGYALVGEDMPPSAQFQSYKVPLNATLDPNTIEYLLSELVAQGKNVTPLLYRCPRCQWLIRT